MAAYLTRIIKTINQPFVIGLDSPCGTGKSFFIKNWQRQLQLEGFQVVYFNAWETDYSDDVLIAFISSIKNQLDKKNEIANFVELAKKGGAYLTRNILPIAAKGVARKIIGSETVKELIDITEDTDDISDLFGDIALEKLKKHDDVTASVESFKKYLSECVIKLTEKSTEKEKKKLIIFVDELDRCRPTYAIEVLECIKHLFNVPGLVFIIAIDNEQLNSSVSALYGTNINSENYLNKFFDWRLNLPKPPAVKFVQYLYTKFNLDETKRIYGDQKYGFLKSFGVFSHSFNLSLREQAQSFTIINLIIRSLNKDVGDEDLLLGCLPALRIKCKKQLDECLSGHMDPEDFIKFIESRLDMDLFGNNFGSGWNGEYGLRRYFLSYFINNDHRNKLNDEYSLLKSQNTAQPLTDDVKARFEYITMIIEAHKIVRSGHRKSSLAAIVNAKFETASELVSQQGIS